MKPKPALLKRIVQRFFDWINPKIGLPTTQQTVSVNSRWDYAHTNNLAMWDADDDQPALREAMALRKSHPSLAFESLLELAEAGSVIAMNEIAESYYWGRLGVSQDDLRAERWFKAAVKAGSQRAILNYGKMLLWRGDCAAAEVIFSKGVADDWAPALYWLARTRLDQSRTRRTLLEVRPLLERAAAHGHPQARWHLGRDMALGRHGLRYIPRGFRILHDYVTETIATWEKRGNSVPKTTSSGDTLH